MMRQAHWESFGIDEENGFLRERRWYKKKHTKKRNERAIEWTGSIKKGLPLLVLLFPLSRPVGFAPPPFPLTCDHACDLGRHTQMLPRRSEQRFNARRLVQSSSQSDARRRWLAVWIG